MNTVSGSTSLWRLLEEYEPLDVLHWQYKGLWSRLGGAENWSKLPNVRLLGTFCTFPYPQSKK